MSLRPVCTGLAAAALLASAAPAAAPPRAAPQCQLALPGGTTALSALRGKVVYVDFWASWCVSCLLSFPFMGQLQQQLGGRGLKVVGVNLDQRPEDAQRFLARRRPAFDVALGANADCARRFGVAAMPSSFLIDRRGNIRATHAGFRPSDAQALRTMVESLLAEPAPRG